MNSKKILILLLLLCMVYLTHAKNTVDSFIVNLPLADSVILISHAGIQKRYYPDERRYWIVDSVIDIGLLKEYRKLGLPGIERLCSALRTKDDMIRIGASCFMPHHAILAWHGGKLSYMDICFRCHNYVLSVQQRIVNDLGSNTWKQLRSFFRSEGMRFALEEENKD